MDVSISKFGGKKCVKKILNNDKICRKEYGIVDENV